MYQSINVGKTNFDPGYKCEYLDADLWHWHLKGTKYQHVIEGQEFIHVKFKNRPSVLED